MKITLMHAPLDDPTLPYHSTAYLKGHLVQNGFTDVVMRDINAEFVNYCLEESSIEAFYDEGERRLEKLSAKPTLGFEEQEQYFGFWLNKRIEASELRQAVETFRDREALLEYPNYLEAVNRVLRYFAYLGVLGYPSEISTFSHTTRGRFSSYSLKDLLDWDLNRQICYSFLRYFEERLSDDSQLAESDCLGISVIYDHQLHYALCFAKLLKQRWPEKMVLLGGTSIGQLYKHMKDKQNLKHFFGLCDGIVVGEGETAICEIADAGWDIKDLDKKSHIPNMVRYDAPNDRVVFPPHIHYENVARLGKPIYDHPWDLYLSPENGLNYAPTRGCYWNRCTFCDYGLNEDMPTSPWRERRIEQVIEDLTEACSEHQAKYVYFAVDVMAPGYLERLSDAIVESDLDIRWAAELRMEKIFSAQRCEKMARAGCVCVSFGMESGNQRILDLIDKGTKVEYMGVTMENFAQAGIAVQLMTFINFPTETVQEKQDTYDFIQKHRDHWAVGGMGTFLLTGTAMIAKAPEKFGLSLIETQDNDIIRSWAYKVDETDENQSVSVEEGYASFNDTGSFFPPVLGRPWAGGHDTLHTMIYYDTYERDFFKDNPMHQPDPRDSDEAAQPAKEKPLIEYTVHIPGTLGTSDFDVGRIISTRRAFAEYLRDMHGSAIEPTYDSFQRWQASFEPLPRQDETHHWLVFGDKCIQLDKLVYRVLKLASENHLPLGDLLDGLKPDLRERLLDYFGKLESVRSAIFHDPDKPPPLTPRVARSHSEALRREVSLVPAGNAGADLPVLPPG